MGQDRASLSRQATLFARQNPHVWETLKKDPDAIVEGPEHLVRILRYRARSLASLRLARTLLRLLPR